MKPLTQNMISCLQDLKAGPELASKYVSSVWKGLASRGLVRSYVGTTKTGTHQRQFIEATSEGMRYIQEHKL